MASKEDTVQRKISASDAHYQMPLPRIGNCIIVNNLATDLPGSRSDAETLHTAYRDVGFDVYQYSDCDTEKMEQIKMWVFAEESHQFCNSLVMCVICRGSPSGELLDRNGAKVYSAKEVLHGLAKVATLKGKPKVLMLQLCQPELIKEDLLEFLEVPDQDDMFLTCVNIREYSTSPSGHGGSAYLQTFAQHLKEEYMNMSMDRIFAKVKETMQVELRLDDEDLSILASELSPTDMKTIAMSKLGIKSARIDSLEYESRGAHNFIFELLRTWRNRSTENNKERLSELLHEAARDPGIVNPESVDQVLKVKTQGTVVCSVQIDRLTRRLNFSEFYKKKIFFSASEKYYDYYQKEIEKVRGEVRRQMEEEREQIIEEEKRKLKTELEESVNKMEREREEERKQIEEREQQWKEKLARLSADKEKYEQEVQTIREENEEQKRKLREAELVTLRNLQEQTRLSAQRLSLTEESLCVKEEAQVVELQEEIKQLTEKTEEADNKDKLVQLVQYKKELQQLQEKMRKQKEEEEDRMQKSKEEMDKMMSTLEEEKKQLEQKNRQLTEAHKMSGGKTTLQLDLWSCYNLTVMRRTEQFVVYGRMKEDGPLSLAVFTRPTGGTLQGEQVTSSCQHEGVNLLGMEVGEQELLAVACPQCEDIKLMNLRTQHVTTAHRGHVLRMCRGDTNRLYVESPDGSVTELDCSGSNFTKIKENINTGISRPYSGLCYMSPKRHLVVSDRSRINVVSCVDNQEVWSAEEKIDGKKIDPYGLCFSHQHNALFVGDCLRSRILVLVPDTGAYKKTISLPSDFDEISDFCLYQDQIVVLYKIQDKFEISYCTVT